MRKEKCSARRVSGSKALALVLALILVAGCVIGGTLAWLVDNTDPVINTFTTSDINIELKETKTEFQMIPGWTIDKDPVVTVKAGSEDCWLFIKVEETGKVTVGTGSDAKTYNFSDFIAYKIADDWTAGKGVKSDENLDGDGIPTNVYYRKVEGVNVDKSFDVLGADSRVCGSVTYGWAEDQVLTLPTVTKEMINAVNAEGADKPTLTFTAYAAQLYKTNKPASGDATAAQFTAAEAWKIVDPD